MAAGTISHLRSFPRPLPPSHERPISLKSRSRFPAVPDLHPVSSSSSPYGRTTSGSAGNQNFPTRSSAIPTTRHPRRRFFVRSLDNFPTFGDQAHERCDEQPHVESWNVRATVRRRRALSLEGWAGFNRRFDGLGGHNSEVDWMASAEEAV